MQPGDSLTPDDHAPGTADAGLFLVDLNGRVVAVDDVCETIIGAPAADLVGVIAADLVSGLAPRDGAGSRAVVVHRPDGSDVELRATISTLTVGGATAVALHAAPEVPVGMFEALGDHVYALELSRDGTARSRYHGPGVERLLGGLADRDPVAAWALAVHEEDRPLFARHLRRLLHGEVADDILRLRGVDGVTRSISFRAWPTATLDGALVHGIAADVTARSQFERILKATLGQAHREREEVEELRREAERQARTDALTDVANRRHGVEVLERALTTGSALAVLLLDVDHFKRINDAYGHAAGDAVLRAVAQRVRERVRDVDTVVRWGGEEFCVVCPGVGDDRAMRSLAEGLRLAIEAEPVAVGTDGLDVAVTVSIGAVRAGADLVALDDLVDAADRALYAAKRRGRNQTRLYSEWRFEDFVAEDPEAIRIAEALALTASIREGMSPIHPMQVADLAARVAEELGLGAPTVLRCRLGGWLHDVGMVAIPDRILDKRTAFDADDWAVMAAHPLIGEEIIRRVAGLKEAARAVRHHHERYDGSGYPDGLAGAAIPIEARIVAAADAYSALTTTRAHRSACDQQAALTELERGAGTQFDAHVVAALAVVLGEHWTHLDSRLPSDVEGERRRDDGRAA